MVVTDPVADFLTRIRNANIAKHRLVKIPDSKLKRELARVFTEEGYVQEYGIEASEPYDNIVVKLKYQGEEPVITGLRRQSKPGQRRYFKSGNVPQVMNGYGVAVLSTSHGVMTGRQAEKEGVGGEYLCSIW